jgi:hypothetical protein
MQCYITKYFDVYCNKKSITIKLEGVIYVTETESISRTACDVDLCLCGTPQ